MAEILILSAGRRVSLMRAFQQGAEPHGSRVVAADMNPSMSAACQLAQKYVTLPHVGAADYVYVVGLRPGEKLYEELLIGDDPQPTQHPRILNANEHFLSFAQLAPELRALKEELKGRSSDAALARLKALVPEFNHNPGP